MPVDARPLSKAEDAASRTDKSLVELRRCAGVGLRRYREHQDRQRSERVNRWELVCGCVSQLALRLLRVGGCRLAACLVRMTRYGSRLVAGCAIERVDLAGCKPVTQTG